MELFTNFTNLIIFGHFLLRYDWLFVPKPMVIGAFNRKSINYLGIIEFSKILPNELIQYLQYFRNTSIATAVMTKKRRSNDCCVYSSNNVKFLFFYVGNKLIDHAK